MIVGLVSVYVKELSRLHSWLHLDVMTGDISKSSSMLGFLYSKNYIGGFSLVMFLGYKQSVSL